MRQLSSLVANGKKGLIQASFVCFSLAAALNANVDHFGFEESFLPYYTCGPQVSLTTLCKSLYEGFQLDPSSLSEYKIPKLVHFIWLGSPLPSECEAMVRTWRECHPDWIVKVWNDADAAAFGLENQRACDIANNYGEKSDIFRYEILYRFGGVYIDTDFECIKPFDNLHKSCEFYTGLIGSESQLDLLNGLIGSVPGHPIIRACIDHLRIGNGDNDPERIMLDTGPYHLKEMFLKCVTENDRGNVVALPPNFFYPYPATHRISGRNRKVIKMMYARPESWAIHYWSSSWQKK